MKLLFLLLPRTDDAAGLVLAKPYQIQQRTVGGAAELAAAALDTVHDVVLLRLVPAVQLRVG